MLKAIVIFYSRTGNTKKMAESVAKGLEASGIEVTLKDVKEATAKELLAFDIIVMGSPTYYGGMAAELKQLLDNSVKFHGKLDGKIGAAFSSSANVGGGNETTVLDILKAMLIHGMIIQGDPEGDHYGPVAVPDCDARATKQCVRLGERLGKLAKNRGA